MEKDFDREFERFPVEKRRIRFEEPPEMIFFDVDEESEEAEFIRVDDLFTEEPETAAKLTGKLSFTLFPRKSGEIIESRLSRLIHRTMVLTGLRLERQVEKIRIRPTFAQWQIDLPESDEPEQIVREFRADLEELLHSKENDSQIETFWSDNCFVSPIDKEIPDETIIRVAKIYQDNQESVISEQWPDRG